MNLKTPAFWKTRGLLSTLLLPLAALYDLGGQLRRRQDAEAAGIPVICVGNVTAGGTGKTPIVLDLLQRLAAASLKPHALTRGYGGRLQGPVMVDLARHDSADVGDEALLLAAQARSWVSANRVSGARQAAMAGANIIVMDDGFQNPALWKDVSLLVVDGGFGFGNGRLIPAGPLREPLGEALKRTDALVMIGDDQTGAIEQARAIVPDLPILFAHVKAHPADAKRLSGERVVAFAGIGRPEKFFETVRATGADVVDACGFGDHHVLRAAELNRLREKADTAKARLVTTEKDFVRIAKADRHRIETLRADLIWKDETALMRLLAPVIEQTREA